MASEKTKPLSDQNGLAANESDKGSRNADRHAHRISRLGECKRRSHQMGQYLGELRDLVGLGESRNVAKLAIEVQGCANYLVFHNYYTVDQVRLAKVHTCKKHMLCPFCARARAAKSVKQYLERFQVLREAHPSLTPALLTLTVKNGDSLSERFLHLMNSWKKYQNRRRQFFKQNRGFNELCKVDGAVFSYEVTKNKKTGEWHPHLHAVVLLNDFIDRKKLSSEWESITGDSKIVDIRKLKGESEEEMAEAFCEVFKYALKFSDLTLEDNFHAYEALQGKRLQGAFGSFWGVKVPESATDDLDDLEGLPYLEMFYRFMPSKGYDLQNVTVCSRHEEEASGPGGQNSEPRLTTTSKKGADHDCDKSYNQQPGDRISELRPKHEGVLRKETG